MTMPHAYSDQAAPIKAVTPETDTLLPERLQDHTDADYMALVNHARKLERERDEARWHADADVCNSIECGSSAPGKDGWRKDCEADEYELRYAAKRGLIERHPERPTWLRFTSAGKEHVRG